MAPASRLRHSQGGEESRRPVLVLIGASFLAGLITYFVLSPVFQIDPDDSNPAPLASSDHLASIFNQKAACCRGIQHQELWGSVIVWGSSNKVNSSAACCQACKSRCPLDSDAPCTCNSWVFCHDPVRCGTRHGECWLKKQEDPLSPDVQESSSDVIWTSGLVYGKNVGIVQIETEYGAIRLQLLPDCAPLSVAYVIELLKLRHCAGCNFYRGESRGSSWDAEGKPVTKNSRGPPHGLLQGTLEAEGLGFKPLPAESCPSISRGVVGWVSGGPDFFISLADHNEWYPKNTVFAKVIPADMPLVEKLANLPTSKSVWSGVEVGVLKKPISLKLQRLPSLSSS